VKLPRDESGSSLTKCLKTFGYSVTRQTSSHIRLTTYENGEHHVTIPDHKNIKIGTLNSILVDVSNHLQVSKEELVKKLW
jgi:predicted RNA binding protein YcfA (HicA-like mRNA interferase family)